MERKEKIIIAASVGVMLLLFVGFVLWLVFGRNKFKPKPTSKNILSKKEVYAELGKEFGLTPAHICAVAKIEGGSDGGYYPDGRPNLLFEGHVFWKELKKRGKDPNNYLPEWGDVLNPTWDRSKYGNKRQNLYVEYDRLERAEALCKKIGLDDGNTAALNAAGWGMFGIQGFSADNAGYPSAQAMVKDFKENPNRIYVNVRAFFNFCKSKTRNGENLIEKLKKEDWAGFAYSYNGAAYAKNKYDTKLAEAFQKCKNGLL
jgi:N-acetylmuramidase